MTIVTNHLTQINIKENACTEVMVQLMRPKVELEAISEDSFIPQCHDYGKEGEILKNAIFLLLHKCILKPLLSGQVHFTELHI